jgi:hypothetical protein
VAVGGPQCRAGQVRGVAVLLVIRWRADRFPGAGPV